MADIHRTDWNSHGRLKFLLNAGIPIKDINTYLRQKFPLQAEISIKAKFLLKPEIPIKAEIPFKDPNSY